LRFRQAGRQDVAHCDIAGFPHQLADQLAAHSAAAGSDYRDPPANSVMCTYLTFWRRSK
jgi:hypothetical protein